MLTIFSKTLAILFLGGSILSGTTIAFAEPTSYDYPAGTFNSSVILDPSRANFA